MDPINEINRRLEKYPSLQVKKKGGSIVVMPSQEGGFPVSFIVEGNEFVVYFDGWHERFSDAQEAINCFAFGLSQECRLVVYKRGGMTYKWTMQYIDKERWIDDSSTGLLFFPYWRKRESVVLQNRLVPANIAMDSDSSAAGHL